jgi:O-antigen ligase
MNPVLSMTIGVGGVLLLILILRSFRAAKASGFVTPTFVFGAVLVLLTNLTSTVSQFSGGRLEEYTELRQAIVELSGPAMMASRVLVPGLLIVASLYCLYRLGRRQTPINIAALIFAMLLLVGAIAGVYQGFPFADGRSLGYLLVVIAVALAPRNRDILQGAAHGAGLLVGLSALVSLVDPTSASSICDLRKCGALGGLYNGVAFSFNEFGMLMAIAIPTLYFGLSRGRLTFVLSAALLGFASGSRSAQLAIGVTLILLFLHHLAARKGKKPGSFLPITAALIAAACAVALPLIGLPESEFTGRVRLWNIGFDYFAESPLVGNGSDLWSSFQSTGLIARASAYSTHNEFVDILFVTGLVGLVLFILATSNVIRHNKGNLGRVAMLVVPALILGSTERPWSLGYPDWLSWSFLVVLATAFAVPAAGRQVELLPNPRSSEADAAPERRRSVLVRPRKTPSASVGTSTSGTSVLVKPTRR